MSFILDALKKADAERQAGALPDLRTMPPALEPAARPQARWPWPVLAAAIVLLGGAGWMVIAPWKHEAGRNAPAVNASAPLQAHELAPLPAPDAAASPTPAAPVIVTVLPVPPAVPAPPKPVPSPAQMAIASPARRTAAPAALPSLAAIPAPAAVVASARTVTANPVADAPNVLSMAQLPQSLRSELPALSVGGSMYSANPADRMLLIDKRMLHEGDEISPGLILEMIQPKSAVLRYKGTDFRLPF